MGINSDLPVTKLVANLPNDDVVPAVAMALLSQTTLVVPVGVDVGAVLYKEFFQMPLILLSSEMLVVI